MCTRVCTYTCIVCVCVCCRKRVYLLTAVVTCVCVHIRQFVKYGLLQSTQVVHHIIYIVRDQLES